MTLIIFSIIALVVVGSIYSFLRYISLVEVNNNDELIPERMVDFAGFIDFSKTDTI